MSALVNYAAGELAPTAMDIGVAVGKSLGASALSGASKMYQARKARPGKKSYKQKASFRDPLRDVGRKMGANPNRRSVRESGVSAITNKRLYVEPLIRIEKDVAGDENISKRSRDTINYKGTKICFFSKSVLKTPVFFNWAIVTPKARNFVDGNRFLRGGTTERDTALNINSPFMDLRCCAINSDEFHILKHKRMTILPDSDKAANDNEGRDFRIIEDYIPIKKQVFFDGDAAVPLTNVFMVWWCDYWNSPTGVQTNTLDVSWRMLQYFQDVP